MLISYKNKFKVMWDLMTLFFSVLNAVQIPFEISFGRELHYLYFF